MKTNDLHAYLRTAAHYLLDSIDPQLMAKPWMQKAYEIRVSRFLRELDREMKLGLPLPPEKAEKGGAK